MKKNVFLFFGIIIVFAVATQLFGAIPSTVVDDANRNKQVRAVSLIDESGSQVGTSSAGLAVKMSDSASLDAFARLRVSEPLTIFDSKQIFDNQPLFWDESLESGAGITSAHATDTASTVITSSDTTAGVFTRQTFMRFNYQPGKSQLVFMTGILDRSGGGTGVERRIGYFDDDNGIFFEDDAGTIGVTRRTNVTSTAVDNTVTQANWNIDDMDGDGVGNPSNINIDWTKVQIFCFDFEWLGAGRVRMGLVVNGMIFYVHEFVNANILDKVFMSTPDLPLRYQMVTTASSPVSTLEAICTTVISEGGVQDTGTVRNASTDNTQVDAAVVGTLYAVKGIRLKSTHLGATIKILKVALQIQSASDDGEWVLMFNPTIAGSPTWVNEVSSAVQTFTGATANTITGGTRIDSDYVATGAGQSASSSSSQPIANALLLGSQIDGTPQTIVLCFKPFTNVNTLVEGSITWRQSS